VGTRFQWLMTETMVVNAIPLLEDLRHYAAPTWLWDAGRKRIVWANAAGIAAFDCETLFDLIDRPFDSKEPGVEAIAALGARMTRGDSEEVQLVFPSTGSQEPFLGRAYLHPLADGRPGLLVVIDLPAQPEPAVEELAPLPADNQAQFLLEALPHGAAICDSELLIIARNGQLGATFDQRATASLETLLANPDRFNRLQQRAQLNAVVGSIESIPTINGLREFRLTLNTIAGRDEAHRLLLLEDITERRKLERELSERADTQAPPKTTFSSPDQVFAEIGRQLTNKLATPAPVATVLPDVAPTPTPAKASTRVAEDTAVIPEAVRAALEQANAGIAICQQGKPVYITRKALGLLGLSTRADAAEHEPFWDALKDVKSGATQFVVSPSGKRLSVSHMPMPWQNGRADQFSFRDAPADVAAEEPPAPVASKAEVIEAEPAAVEAAAKPVMTAPSSVSSDHGLQQELKSILDVVSDGIITLSETGEILSFSAGAEAIFGARSTEAVGQQMTEFLAQDSRKVWRDYFRSLSGPGLGTVFNDGREMMAKHAQGGPHPLFVSVSRLQAPGSKAAYCAVVRDITPWKKTERELTEAKEKAEQANRRKSDFIAHISHELRTPLNAILGFSDVMRSERLGSFGNSKYLAYANDIHMSGTHLLAIVNDLLDLARVEAGKLELNFTAVSLEDVADYVVRMTREDAAAAHVIVRRSVPQGLPRVVGDLKSLRQVLLNLVSNAIKFTDAGGEVLISASAEQNGAVALRVKDNGVGMTADALEAALKPFGRVEDADRPRPGTGLGLPLTKSLVEANRAKLDLHSEPGRGTLAEIIFPGPRVLAE
jgi:PAS domain S-box-containing protein